jgi:hypothetical protein
MKENIFHGQKEKLWESLKARIRPIWNLTLLHLINWNIGGNSMPNLNCQLQNRIVPLRRKRKTYISMDPEIYKKTSQTVGRTLTPLLVRKTDQARSLTEHSSLLKTNPLVKGFHWTIRRIWIKLKEEEILKWPIKDSRLLA